MSARQLITYRVGPPVLWRTSRWCIALATACAVAALSVLVWRTTLAPRKQAWQRYAVMALGLTPLCIIYPVGYWVQRGVRRDWRRSGGRMCMHCGYDVRRLDRRGTCPECGKSYDVDADSKHWSDVGMRQPMPTRAAPSKDDPPPAP